MAATLPNGSVLALATVYGAVKAMSALSNANPGVATLEASHDVAAGNIVEVTSGWLKADGRVFKAGTVAGNNVPLVGLDTTNLTRFPTGGGVGSVREITDWVNLSGVLDAPLTGGEQQFTTFGFMEEDDDRQLPTTRSPMSMTIQLADDPAQPWFAALQAADEAGAPRALRLTLKSGAVIYYNGYVSFNSTPTLQRGSIMSVTATFSLVGRHVRYAPA